MARWREKAESELDPEVAAALEEADQIERLATYYFRLAEPPLPELKGEDGWPRDLTLEYARELCDQYPEHPAAVKFLTTFETAEEMRQEALARG